MLYKIFVFPVLLIGKKQFESIFVCNFFQVLEHSSTHHPILQGQCQELHLKKQMVCLQKKSPGSTGGLGRGVVTTCCRHVSGRLWRWTTGKIFSGSVFQLNCPPSTR